jgi:hypothetical protein
MPEAGQKRSSTSLRPSGRRAKHLLAVAEERGLASGPKRAVVRARMNEALLAEAKRVTGITSDSELVEAALASLAVEDDFMEWLWRQVGTVDRRIDLEF